MNGQIYNCSCPWGYDGENCDGYINVCQTGENDCARPIFDAPGHNGSEFNVSFCQILGPGEHECGCVAGYEGDGVDGGGHTGCQDIDECASSPCQNGA
eukprot:SAG22_NODE_6570_length_837_cov_0.981030_1_plen_97_part_10